MGWGDVISIGLGLGNAALNASNASTLQQMKLQQAGETLYREIIISLRNGLFHLKSTAEDVLSSEDSTPLRAAGAMRILDYQLSLSGVTSDLFPELADKEYASATAKLINGNSSRMYAALDDEDRKQVDQLMEHLRRLADIQYYLEHRDSASRLQAAKGVADVDTKVLNNKGCLVAVGLFLLSGVLIYVSAELAMLSVCVASVMGLIFMAGFASKRQAANTTKKNIMELENSIDLTRFYALDQQFKSPDEANQLQQESEQYVENFFGDYTLLRDGWRS